MKNSGTGFIKNVGQVFDMNKKPCPDVYYQYQINEAAIFLTKNGISFGFYKKDKTFNSENEAPKKTDLIAEVTGRACRLDVNLVNATILKQNIIEEDLNYKAGRMNIYFDNFNEANSNLYYSKKLIVKEVYPGIDWVLKMSDETGLKQEFIVHSGADYSNIKLLYNGVNKLSLNQNRDGILAQTELGNVNDADLKCFTSSGKIVKSAYLLNSSNEINIQVEKYNLEEDLIIDPQISLSRTWATYLGGGSEDYIFSNKIDLIKSQLYVVGRTASNPFPPLSPTSGSIGSSDAFVCCFALNGTKLWCNLFGSSLPDDFKCVTIDGNSNVIAAGITGSTTATTVKYPLLNPGSGSYFQSWSAPLPVNQHPDAMITKMDFNGVVSWSTIFGGADEDAILGITTNSSNDIIIVGHTAFQYAPNNVVNYFPYLNAGGYFHSLPNNSSWGLTSIGFIALFNSTNTQLKWSTLFKACWDLYDVTCDASNNIYMVGYGALATPELTGPGGSYQQNANGIDAVIAKFRPITYNLIWGTNFGGNGDDIAASCAINPVDNSLFICGRIENTAVNFPFLSNTGYFNSNYQLPSSGTPKHSFIAQFDASHKEVWGTLFSGNGTDEATSVKVGSGGTIFLGGQNKRPLGSPPDNFPLFNPGSPFYYDGGNTSTYSYDGYIAMFYDVRTLRWCTYYGTTSCNEYTTDIDVAGRIAFYAGFADNNPSLSMITTQQEVGSSWIQTAQGIGQYDGIIAKFYNQFNQNLKENNGVSETDNSIRLLNNPTGNGELGLLVLDSDSKVDYINLTDITGKDVQLINSETSDQLIKLNYGNISKGIYILRVETNSGLKSFKVIFN